MSRNRGVMFAFGGLSVAAVPLCAPTLTPWRVDAYALLLFAIPVALSVAHGILGTRRRMLGVTVLTVVLQSFAFCYSYLHDNRDALATMPNQTLEAACAVFVCAYSAALLLISIGLGWASLRVWPYLRRSRGFPVLRVDD